MNYSLVIDVVTAVSSMGPEYCTCMAGRATGNDPYQAGWHNLPLLAILISTVNDLCAGEFRFAYIHRESKKGDTILLSIYLLNIGRFSQLFHRRTQLELCNKTINKDPTSPQMCCYTTL